MGMRHTVALVFILVSGAVTSGSPGPLGSSGQRRAAIEGAACAQNFPSADSPDPRATVVLCGLDNPRGIAFSQSALYVAEAGRGGLGLATAPCFRGQAGGNRCYAPNGAITRLWNGIQERIATGFPSHANATGGQAIGPNDIAVLPATGASGGADFPGGSPQCGAGCAYVTIGLQQPPVFRDRFPFLANFAKLARLTGAGDWSYVADLGAFETSSDPDQIFYSPAKLDSNPYGLLAEPSGRTVLVTDAGGNSLVSVAAAGALAGADSMEISTRAVFAPHPTSTDDTVPTSLALGPDGAHYVGELTGFPLIRGIANIYRVARDETPVVCLSGFTQIMDLEFDTAGDLYVLEFSGSLTRVSPDERPKPGRGGASKLCGAYAAGARTVVATGFTNPTSVAIGPDGAAYVSNRGTSPGVGQVVRIQR